MIVYGENEAELHQTTESIIQIVSNWKNAAEIMLNKAKTEVMSIGKRKIEENRDWREKNQDSEKPKIPGSHTRRQINLEQTDRTHSK